MTSKYIAKNNLQVSKNLVSFIEDELLMDLNITPEKFWSGFDNAVHELAPKNRELIKIRGDIQKKINDWQRNKKIDF